MGARGKGRWSHFQRDIGRVTASLPGDGGPDGRGESGAGSRRRAVVWLVGVALVLLGALGYQRVAGYTPLGDEYWLRIPGGWPQVTSHQRLLARFLVQVPAGVPGTATADLFPHVAHRELLYQFPFVGQAQWALVDVAGTTNRHPAEIHGALDMLLRSGWGVVDAADGYALLMRGRGSAAMPDSFYDFARAGSDDADQPEHRVDITFDGKLKLLGYRRIDDPKWRRTTLRFYWQALAPLPPDTAVAIQVVAPDGSAAVDTEQTPMPAMIWYPPGRWQVGETVVTEGLQWYLPGAWAPVVSVTAGGRPLAASGCQVAGSVDDAAAGSPAGNLCLPDGRAQLAEVRSVALERAGGRARTRAEAGAFCRPRLAGSAADVCFAGQGCARRPGAGGAPLVRLGWTGARPGGARLHRVFAPARCGRPDGGQCRRRTHLVHGAAFIRLAAA